MNYKVIRSSRKTLSLTVTPENEIIVRCPKRLGDAQIQSFIDEKKDWLNKIIGENAVKAAANEEIIKYRQVLVGGERLPLLFAEHNEVTSAAVYVKNIQGVKKAFLKEFSDGFITYVKILSQQLNLPVSQVAIRQYKSRWGCCDAKGKITFNWLLFMLPYELQKYIIIHELCHTVYFNHSKEFWGLVSGYEPDYKKLRNALKSYNFLIKLY